MRRYTERWAARLALAVAASVLLHVVPFGLFKRFWRPKPSPLDVQIRTVEIGLERPREGAQRPAQTAPRPAQPPQPVQPPEPAAQQPPQPPQQPEERAERPARPRPTPRERSAVEPLPLPRPRVQLREPDMALARRRPRLIDPATDLHAQRDAGARPQSPPSLPAFAAAAGDLAPMVPRGALVSVLIRSDRVRENPNANSVRRLLRAIPDWDAMLGGSHLDPVTDLDSLLLAAARPFGGANGEPPDWFVLARGAHGSDAVLRRAVEEMAEADAPRAPSPVAPPGMDAGEEPDAAAAAGGGEAAGGDPARVAVAPDAGRSIWRTERGVQVATLTRYGARRSFVMLGDGTAAIALPGQVDALLSALARRPEGLQSQDDGRLVLLGEAEGIRNTITFNTWRGPFPMPSRAAAGLYQIVTEATPTGGADLVASMQYDDREQARAALEMWEYSRGRWRVMITERLGARGGLNRFLSGAVANLMGIDIGAVEGAIDAMQFRVEGDRVVLRATLDAAQVRALLNVAALGAR